MTDTSALPQFVVSAFDGREFPDWAKQSRETLLNHFLEWNGICGYTDQILKAITAIDQFLADNSEPAWQLPLFTDEDRETIVQMVMDEIGDASIKDLAHQHLEDEDLIECIGYAYPFEDPEHLATMLQSIIDEDYVNGEFLRFHDDDGDNLTGQVEFAKRMGLIDEAEEVVTERGLEFIARFA